MVQLLRETVPEMSGLFVVFIQLSGLDRGDGEALTIVRPPA